ncbi:MAG: hypothetical protein FWF82_00525 [Oscillospiraceae bacterium]|nr:hypothetical protein [Oscillospiraceae bacterium]
MKIKNLLKTVVMFAAGLLLMSATACEFSPNSAGQGYNKVIVGIGILAGLTLLFFVVVGIVTIFYKGKDVHVKIVSKKEPKVLRGGLMGKTSAGYKGGTDTSRKARRQKGRIRYSKVTVELDGETKQIRCSDIVIFDKLLVGRIMHIRIRFNEIIKILK